MAMSKKLDNAILSANFDVTVIFPIYGWLGTVWKLDSRYMFCSSYIFINYNLLSYKNRNENYKNSKTGFIILLWVKLLFLQKQCWFFAQKKKKKKMLTLAKLRDPGTKRNIFWNCIYGCTYVPNFKSPAKS